MPTLTGRALPCARSRRGTHPINCSSSILSPRVSPPHQFYLSSTPRLSAQHEVLRGPSLTPASQPQFSQTGFQPSAFDGLERPRGDHEQPDERILKLGKTLRILSPLLPNILTNPLPPKILSPSITLHLFPSTHPHLPTVKGRTLYRAALWTVPVAWSSLPLLGNVKLKIISERIVRAGTVLDPARYASGEQPDDSDERLVVRWRTEPRSENHHHGQQQQPSFTANPRPTTTTTASASSSPAPGTGPSQTGTNKGLSVLLGGDAPIFKLSKEEQFTGLFIFSFDEEGRIASHTIEHADDACGWERTPKFVTLADWLIGKARESLDPSPAEPGLAFQGYHSTPRDSFFTRARGFHGREKRYQLGGHA
ncbi:uncharacterized protein BO66DRAFT_244943 [Aspergillus aculeatinus CBS 121060]|uniref:Uncharacterized protein n=1 Tax=Aspergillus aculeatinus CBS 121060 TaxID=1448322 RepID=A0ACD1GST5_9EURO|nr:hypothetical protein BO66DRAFT_244943 [Aspergillus aculeatinus CBS 121060]RAH64263.1 hypothetical protein BO66DRAFT_244943 [Aspergillus aculeatinus CBS 121060]